MNEPSNKQTPRPRRRMPRRLTDKELADNTAALTLTQRHYDEVSAAALAAARAREEAVHTAALTGMSLAEISRILGISPARVDQIFNNADKRLSEAAEDKAASKKAATRTRKNSA